MLGTLAFTGPSSSTGCPSTFSTRPSVSRPTGTVIPAPVSMAFIPRTIPSVATMAMQRTRPSPRCCCTTRRQHQPARLKAYWKPSLPQSAAPGRSAASSPLQIERQHGRTALIRNPLFQYILCHSLFPLQSSRAAHNLNNFLRNSCLPQPVHRKAQRIDQLTGVLRRRIRCRHTRCMLRRNRLQQCMKDLRRHIPRHQMSE